VTEAAVAADVHQTLDVHLDTLAEVTLDLAFRVEHGSDLVQLVFAQITDLRAAVYTGLTEHIDARGPADAGELRQPNSCPLVGRQIYTCYTSHNFS